MASYLHGMQALERKPSPFERAKDASGIKDSRQYNLAELKIALDSDDPRHILPPPLEPAAKVLDVGCGSGQSLIAAYADRISFGVDIDHEALKLGKTLSERTCLVNSAAEALPFKSNHFDLVFARVSLPYTNIHNSIREIRRVLANGGRVWLTLHPFSIAWSQAKQSGYKGKIYFAYILLNSLLFHIFQRQFSFLGKRYESFQTERGIREALAQNGFDNIQIERTGHFLVTAQVR
jgi:ubiquinone/menaquinone biosynthesis C-methylase UbiE